ncbi:zinc finger homeobox protein 3 isoform X3 [Denticeps clupeoides]|uniref:zinc finger homeobox protein 3 isoform X3 n=1 Tax=Denticeps clupeoides TaxID=299321 RepID=UPI0010A471DF|nr:zinc finger homeobox protein 3-like isoform X3 [Denticeps clupeoides]
MAEESGETVNSDSSSGSMWLCPLCQHGLPEKDALALHLTDKHSVLPACLEKLLDIAVHVHSRGDGTEASAQVDTDATSPQHEELEKSTTVSEQHEMDTEKSKQIADCGDTQMAPGERDAADEQVDGVRDSEAGAGCMESDQDSVAHPSKTSGGYLNSEKSSGKNCVAAEGDGSRPFKCHACLESFATKTALSVHYNSTTHIQRMRRGSGDNDSAFPARPYISTKPYQCAVCRVSYSHAISLESHLKSVLHQSRSRSAGNLANSTTSNMNTVAPAGSATCSTVGQPSPTAAVVASKDGEQIPQAPSLLSSPVSSAQAVSAFLTLLTSSPNSVPHSIVPPLFTAGAGAPPAAATPQLLPQPQMLMPLILNGLQAQNQSPNAESPSQLLAQSLPVLGLSPAQQALVAQRLGGLQSQWTALGLQSKTHNPEESEGVAEKGSGLEKLDEFKEEPNEEHAPLKLDIKAEENSDWMVEGTQKKDSGHKHNSSIKSIKVDKESDEGGTVEGDGVKRHCHSPLVTDQSLHCDKQSSEPNHKTIVKSAEHMPSAGKSSPLKTTLSLSSLGQDCAKSRPHVSPGPAMLTEFQCQVLWAFLESRSEADAAGAPQEDCEALGREVGLTEEEVRKWLEDARNAKERQKKHDCEKMDGIDRDMDEEECALTIDEGPGAVDSGAMNLSARGERRKDRTLGRESQGESCLTSDSENEEFYTSVIVSDEESRSSSMREETGSPTKDATQGDQTGERCRGGGKVLRSTTVFLSDAEEEDEEEDGAGLKTKPKKRKRESDHDDTNAKKERQDPDLDLELEAQADPPTPLPASVDTRGLPTGVLHSLPLSLSLAPFSTQFISPYVLSLPSSVVGVGVAEADGGKISAFPNAPTITRCPATFSDPINVSPISSHTQPSRYVSNGGDCESALDLSIGKGHSATAASTSVSASDKNSTQKTHLLDGLGLRPTAMGVPGEGGLIVVQVKPDSAIAIPASNSNFINHNNLAKTNTVYLRAAEKVNTSIIEREKEKRREMEKEREQKRPKARRFRDMRRSRTIIQAEQLDVLYGCYFKDPNPGKHEFEQISEWVHLPKKVVQIWFQNMRARERKGEVRFISDGTLAAVGKPLIKFTWPLTQPIFSSGKSNTNSASVAPPAANAVPIQPKPEQAKDEKESPKPVSLGPSRQKEATSSSLITTVTPILMPKTKPETQTTVTMVKIAPKAIPSVIPVPVMDTSAPVSHPPQKHKLGDAGNTEEDEEPSHGKTGPGTANRMVPKLSTTPVNKCSATLSQKQNGLSYWSSKSQFKINTLSREQLGLSTARIATPSTKTVTTTPTPPATTPAKSSPRDVGFLTHSTPRRPRTHLTCLQLSILQSCYETCAHPNALECEAVGTELGLPLKVVQIWFQNTRAKEKRWRLQQEKMSPSSDPSKKAEINVGTYLQYHALRANRPILPKPVQLTVEPSAAPTVGQPGGRETLRGRCDVCNIAFESRAAARDHVFSPRHLATLRTTNFGQPASLINKGSGTGSNSGPGVAGLSSSPSPASSSS